MFHSVSIGEETAFRNPVLKSKKRRIPSLYKEYHIKQEFGFFIPDLPEKPGQ